MRIIERSTVSIAGFLACALFAGAPATAQTTWFPLEPGRHWIYQEEGRGGSRSITVKRQVGDAFVLDDQGTEITVAPGIDIELPGEGRVPFYRFEDDTWLHRDFRTCDDLRIVTVTSRIEEVETQFGQLSNCLKIEFEPGPCVDSGIFVEWWAPDVGLVRWSEGSIMGPRTYVLADTFLGDPVPAFRRGDADGDGATGLNDAIVILEWLFLSAAGPTCLDAADTNDDGGVDISDPVLLLSYLFLGAEAPSLPGPLTCGDDPTEDTLPPCDPASCAQG